MLSTSNIQFRVNGITFTGVTNATWYGSPSTNLLDNAAIRLVSLTFNSTATPRDSVLTFITSAGNYVSYTDFVQFRLFDPISQIVIGVADLPSSGQAKTISAPTATFPSITATDVSAPSDSAKATGTPNSATTFGTESLSSLIAMMMLL